ncbi:MAG: hypothetical protein K2I08_03620 [Muribaculaceae bacterium]|nr:hypothetical protein [Muribaculaceae bacterium]
MRLEDAMVYVLANAGIGLTTQDIADVINRDGLHIRRDCKPVSSAQVYAVVCRNQAIFVKDGGRILLIM